MDVVLFDSEFVEYRFDFVYVVDGAFHSCSDICHEYSRDVFVYLQCFVQGVVVDFAVFLAFDHDVTHVEYACDFDYAVVCFAREVNNTVGE